MGEPGDDLLEVAMPVSSAKEKALDLQGCVGFCSHGNDQTVYFKSRWHFNAAEDNDGPWTSYKLEGLELQTGSRVRARVGFDTNGSNSIRIAKNVCGTVQEVDADENLSITFDDNGE